MKTNLWQIVLLILFASLVVFFRFNQVPKNLSFDEVEFAKLAVNLNKHPYIPYSNLATGHSTLYFYIILISFKIFGVNNFALRFPSALFGVLNIILFYLIVNIVFKRNNSFRFLPLILAFIFITLRWYFNFARFAFETTFLLFFELGALFYLIKEKPNYILSGLLAGLAFNSYTPGRIFFLVPLFYLFITKNRTKLLHFLIPFAIVILPLALYLVRYPDIRFNQQSYLTNPNIAPINKINYFAQNVGKTILMFDLRGDVNGRHNYPFKPALNPAVGSFFIFGLIITIINRRKPINRLFLVYFLIGLLPALFTYPHENPHMLRTFTVLPSLVYFIGQTIILIIKKTPNKYLNTITFGLLILFSLSALYDLRTYYRYQNQVFQQAFEVKQDLSQIIKTKL